MIINLNLSIIEGLGIAIKIKEFAMTETILTVIYENDNSSINDLIRTNFYNNVVVDVITEEERVFRAMCVGINNTANKDGMTYEIHLSKLRDK